MLQFIIMLTIYKNDIVNLPGDGPPTPPTVRRVCFNEGFLGDTG